MRGDSSTAATRQIRLLAVGDISLRIKGIQAAFNQVAEILRNKDILFGNLETALSDRGAIAEKATALCSPVSIARQLQNAGFDIMNLANNHILDAGLEGLQDTLRALDHVGISTVGVGNCRYRILDRSGLRVAFLGYTEYGFNESREETAVHRADPARIFDDIRQARNDSDTIIVSLHWGMENVHYPSPRQIALARKLIDSGAAMVIGHHSHLLQAIERYKNGLIAYSLGNFQFEMPDDAARRGDSRRYSAILSSHIGRGEVIDYNIIPILIDENDVPIPASGRESDDIAQFFARISRPVIENRLTGSIWFDHISVTYIRDSMKSWNIRIRRFGVRHLLQFFRWLVTPFVMRCILSSLKIKLGGRPSSLDLREHDREVFQPAPRLEKISEVR